MKKILYILLLLGMHSHSMAAEPDPLRLPRRAPSPSARSAGSLASQVSNVSAQASALSARAYAGLTSFHNTTVERSLESHNTTGKVIQIDTWWYHLWRASTILLKDAGKPADPMSALHGIFTEVTARDGEGLPSINVAVETLAVQLSTRSKSRAKPMTEEKQDTYIFAWSFLLGSERQALVRNACEALCEKHSVPYEKATDPETLFKILMKQARKYASTDDLTPDDLVDRLFPSAVTLTSQLVTLAGSEFLSRIKGIAPNLTVVEEEHTTVVDLLSTAGSPPHRGGGGGNDAYPPVELEMTRTDADGASDGSEDGGHWPAPEVPRLTAKERLAALEGPEPAPAPNLGGGGRGVAPVVRHPANVVEVGVAAPAPAPQPPTLRFGGGHQPATTQGLPVLTQASPPPKRKSLRGGSAGADPDDVVVHMETEDAAKAKAKERKKKKEDAARGRSRKRGGGRHVAASPPRPGQKKPLEKPLLRRTNDDDGDAYAYGSISGDEGGSSSDDGGGGEPPAAAVSAPHGGDGRRESSTATVPAGHPVDGRGNPPAAAVSDDAKKAGKCCTIM